MNNIRLNSVGDNSKTYFRSFNLKLDLVWWDNLKWNRNPILEFIAQDPEL